MSEADESYDGAMRRAHRAEARAEIAEAALARARKDIDALADFVQAVHHADYDEKIGHFRERRKLAVKLAQESREKT